MTKNKAVFLIAILIILGVLYFLKFNRSKVPFFEMTRGEVMEVRSDGSITIEGYLGSEAKKISFTINSKTTLKNSASRFTKEQVQSGKVFRPTIEVRQGKASELVKGVLVTKVQSKEDLANRDTATAIEIDYSTDEF